MLSIILINVLKVEYLTVPVDREYLWAFDEIAPKDGYRWVAQAPVILRSQLPQNEDEVVEMIAEAGRAIVSHRLVDSQFGNISYVYRDHIFISQTGAPSMNSKAA